MLSANQIAGFFKCNISKKNWIMKFFWHADKQRSWYYHFGCATRYAQNTQNKTFAYLRNISRKAWSAKLIFCQQMNAKVFYKLIVSLWVYVARLAQSTQTVSLQYLCNISRKMWRRNLISCLQIKVKVSSNCYYHFRCVWTGMPKLPKITSLLFFCNILKNWLIKLIFCM